MDGAAWSIIHGRNSNCQILETCNQCTCFPPPHNPFFTSFLQDSLHSRCLPTCLPHVNDFQTCKPNGTMTSEQAVSFLRTVAWHANVVQMHVKVTWARNFNATESLWYKGVVGLQIGFSRSVILQEIRSAWWQLALLMNECSVWMVASWIAEEQMKSVVSERPYSFSTVIWAEHLCGSVQGKSWDEKIPLIATISTLSVKFCGSFLSTNFHRRVDNHTAKWGKTNFAFSILLIARFI